MKMRKIDMGVCYVSGNWRPFTVLIPSDTPSDKIEEVGREALLKCPHDDEVSGSWLLHVWENCEHEIDFNACAGIVNHGNNWYIDVWCKHCGRSGSFLVDYNTKINW